MATIVIALGGNALQREGEATADEQRRVARETAEKLVPLVRQGHSLTIIHGNGPQVGNIVLHEEAINTDATPSMPLDTCVAMSQGSIGYWLQIELSNALHAAGSVRPVTTLVTQVIVDEHDPAFYQPTKPIGPFYPDEATARAAGGKREFVVVEDAGRGWRRVVPSPTPLSIVESASIAVLLKEDTIVVAGGGGGVPVIERNGQLEGVEAVIDKDKTGALLAATIHADMLIILTAVPAVMINYNTPEQQALSSVDTATMEQYIEQGHFAAGSMLPKVQAAAAFAKQTGNVAVIGDLADIDDILAGTKGTHITA